MYLAENKWKRNFCLISLFVNLYLDRNFYRSSLAGCCYHCTGLGCIFKRANWASLVAQWLRIRLPIQGTWVRALVWEDPTCRGGTKLMRHNYWACALELASHNYWACAPRACAPQQEKPPQWEVHALQWRVAPARCNKRKPVHSNEDPMQPKINK